MDRFVLSSLAHNDGARTPARLQ